MAATAAGAALWAMQAMGYTPLAPLPPAPPHVLSCPLRFEDVAISGRAMIRLAREASCRRILIELPYLPATRTLGSSLQPDDYGQWPGGLAQRQRSGLHPLVDAMLEGYDATFVGKIDVGMGVWKLAGGKATAVSHVSDLAFASFERLCSGEYGDAPTQSNHTLILVNPRFTRAANVGQPWDGKLRTRAKELLDNGGWRRLYQATPIGDGLGLRGSGGNLLGVLTVSECWGSRVFLTAQAARGDAASTAASSSLEPIFADPSPSVFDGPSGLAAARDLLRAHAR